MKNFLKILSINILIALTTLSLIEIFFGHWFDKNNLGPYVREHRLRKATYIVNYEGKQIEFIYKRNYYKKNKKCKKSIYMTQRIITDFSLFARKHRKTTYNP